MGKSIFSTSYVFLFFFNSQILHVNVSPGLQSSCSLVIGGFHCHAIKK